MVVLTATIDLIGSVPAVIQDETCVYFWVLYQHSYEFFLPYWWLSKYSLERNLQIKKQFIFSPYTVKLLLLLVSIQTFRAGKSSVFADYPLCQIILKNLNFVLQPPQLLHFHFWCLFMQTSRMKNQKQNPNFAYVWVGNLTPPNLRLYWY